MADHEDEMAEDIKEEIEASEENGSEQQASSEMQGEEQEGQEGATEDVVKTEEELEQELKETQITIPRYAPHSPPEWSVEQMRERWAWHLRLYPIDQEDCRNCILDAATKISQEAWYYVPKRKNGPGCAELCMVSVNEAAAVMARVIRMPFYHQYVTIELTRRGQETEAEGEPFNQILETASVVFDATKCEKIKNTATSKGNQKRRSLWVRYLSENTSKEILRVLFPLSQSTEVETHDDLRIGLVEAHSKTDVLIFMKSFITVIINDVHILALQNKEPAENESETKSELEKTVTALTDLETAPTEVADRSEQRKDDKTQTNRVLKRTLHQQQRMMEGRRREQLLAKRGRGDAPKRGPSGGGWGGGSGDRFGDRRGGGGRFDGRGGSGGFGGGGMYPGDMAAEMMRMQAQLNQTIQNQLMMLNSGPRGGSGGGGGGRYGDRRGGYGGGGGRGGRGGGGGGGGGRKGRW